MLPTNYTVSLSPSWTIFPSLIPTAQAFECKDKDGSHLGVLYMDFFPRASKKGGAWCGSYRSQTYKDGKKVAPVVTVVCNLPNRQPDNPLCSVQTKRIPCSTNSDMLYISFQRCTLLWCG